VTTASAVMKSERDKLAMDRLALIIICLAMLLAGRWGGNANAGPNPAGESNIGAEHGDNGSVNP
jgi:hypothetical protein